jgi:hypothetical protein
MTSLTLLEQLQKQAKSIPLTYKYMAAHLKSGWVRLVLWAQTFYLVKRCCQASAFRMSTLTRNRRTALFHWILAAMKIDAPRKFTAEMFIWNFIQKNNVLDNNLLAMPAPKKLMIYNCNKNIINIYHCGERFFNLFIFKARERQI